MFTLPRAETAYKEANTGIRNILYQKRKNVCHTIKDKLSIRAKRFTNKGRGRQTGRLKGRIVIVKEILQYITTSII